MVKNKIVRVDKDKLNDLKFVSNEIFKKNPEINCDEVMITTVPYSPSSEIAKYSIKRKKKSSVYNGNSIIVNAIMSTISIKDNIKNTNIEIL